MDILRIAAFSDRGRGGNPAGVAIGEHLPSESKMLTIAKEIGYSETAFLAPLADAWACDLPGPAPQPPGSGTLPPGVSRQPAAWRVRYFAPEREVPFCGHATIASGAVLGERYGAGEYRLVLNDSEISVQAEPGPGGYLATLHSPETWSKEAPAGYVEQVLQAFSLPPGDLDEHFPVRFAFAGAKHLILALCSREALAGMAYDFETVKSLMRQEDLITISLLWAESEQRFHARNAFAIGGVYEDPATGAAAAALGGYLRDIGWPGPERFEILQGEDMGSSSRLLVAFTRHPGASVAVSGETRQISEQ